MKGKEIRTLLIVLTSGVLTALLIMLAMLKLYNPEGTYSAGNLLLTPSNAYSLAFTEPGAKGKNDLNYKFKGISFTYYDVEKKEWSTKTLTKEQYDTIYSLVKGDVSLPPPTDAVERLFSQNRPATLEIKVTRMTNESSSPAEMNFTELSFSDQGDYYKISLRQNGGNFNWVYFYHPGIYKDVINIIGTPS